VNEHIDVRADTHASARHGVAQWVTRATADLNEVKGLDEDSIRPNLPDFRKVEVLVKDSRGAPPQRAPASLGGKGLGLKPGGPAAPVTHAPTFGVQLGGDRRHTPR
jgi:hypothetical protein